jgi:hypothetical protein
MRGKVDDVRGGEGLPLSRSFARSSVMRVNVRAELVDICLQLRIGTMNRVLQIERIET